MDSLQFLNPEYVNFDENKYTLLLGVNKNTIDWNALSTMAQKNGFDQKDEIHITIIGFAAGGEIRKVLERPGVERDNTLRDLHSLIDKTDWRFKLEPKRYHIQKEYIIRDRRGNAADSVEHRESYIQMVSVQALEDFFAELNRPLGINFIPPPTHVTLYTHGDNPERARMGIGINSREEFLSLNPQPL